jgi:hypothetical protein
MVTLMVGAETGFGAGGNCGKLRIAGMTASTARIFCTVAVGITTLGLFS